MSPLARPLLALACAALLRAACAQTECTAKAKGINGSKIELPLIHINASLGRDVCFDMKDRRGNKDYICQSEFGRNYELVGLSALACDDWVAPGLVIYDDLSTICVHRNGYLEPEATLEIWEFCLPVRSLPEATPQL